MVIDPKHEPPFDGSPPCPACASPIRSISATIHNFLVRWPDPTSVGKLSSLRKRGEYDPVPDPFRLAVPHPAVADLIFVARDLQFAIEDMEERDGFIRWTQAIVDKVGEYVPRAEQASAAFHIVSDAHFADRRHADGHTNLLCERQGATSIRFLPKRDWHYTVEFIDAGGHLVHQPCGSHLRLHEHFLENLRRDITFYAMVRCSRCGNKPWSEFSVIELDAGATG